MASIKITHLTTKSAWLAAQGMGEYRAESLETQGFIHCSTAEQILTVANSFYRGIPDLVLLWLDPGQLTAEVRWEDPVHSGPHADKNQDENTGLFPHIYGPINLNGVVDVVDFLPDADGVFRNIPGR